MIARTLAILAALAVTAAAPLRAETPDIAQRIELHAIPTQTLSDGEFLTGKEGKPATVTGELRIAQGGGRLPVVVLTSSRTDAGIGELRAAIARLLRERGAA